MRWTRKIAPPKPSADKTEWHKWFAWFPVRVNSRAWDEPWMITLWMEPVMRRAVEDPAGDGDEWGVFYVWEYRDIYVG